MYYTPKRPVKSFQDLEVYQNLLAGSIKIAKAVKEDSEKDLNKTSGAICDKLNELIKIPLLETVLSIPKQIAKAHSIRFSYPKKAQDALEEAMFNCNLAVVYLEQYRDLMDSKKDTDFFEENIKNYLRTRGKIMRLQRSWAKFAKERQEA
ncbi:hypothetical protein AUJ94_02835 [bacterium CG2_30_40_12]|uniref:Four helix bundle protein n=1 Tax=candidate division WWE3 bacterium CG23_combo_of_CG06-09_8_20_14_all_40_14 TaxID=1975095 RepID=A0A2G9XD06_UNCKA|nr:MAG: hypothetical protein AUJ94_02835 [bacterium CG2_30_40_12]PIP04849.1 MAG: hypothetical protein COX53_00205 [candidate division WWE3 bacterium CG23_combo_of_CG06-09_8_20_14_all_40_14]